MCASQGENFTYTVLKGCITTGLKMPLEWGETQILGSSPGNKRKIFVVIVVLFVYFGAGACSLLQ